MTNINRSLKKFRDTVKPRRLPARVGWQDGTIYDSTMPNYIRLHWPDGVQFEAWNDGAPGSFGSHVDVIEDPDVPGLLKALSPRQVYSWQDYGYSIIKPHRLTHQWPNGDWAPIEMRQFMPLHPSVSSFTLSLRAGWVKTATAWVYYEGESVSLATSKPATGARFSLVSISAAGVLTVTDGTVKTLYTLALADIPTLPAGHTPVCVVRLYAGQTEIRDSGTGTTDLIDVRFTSFGGDGSTAIWGNISGDVLDQTDLNKQPVTVKTDSYVATASDSVIVCNKATAMTITLPAATGSGTTYNIKSIGAGAVTIDGDGAETIDGQTNQVIYQWEALTIIDYASGEWAIL